MIDNQDAMGTTGPAGQPKGFLARLAARFRLRRAGGAARGDDGDLMEAGGQPGTIDDRIDPDWEPSLDWPLPAEVELPDDADGSIPQEPSSGDGDPASPDGMDEGPDDEGPADDDAADDVRAESRPDPAEAALAFPDEAATEPPSGEEDPHADPEGLASVRGAIVAVLRKRSGTLAADPMSDVVVDASSAEIVEVESGLPDATAAVPEVDSGTLPALSPDPVGSDGGERNPAECPEPPADAPEGNYTPVLRSDGSPLPRHRLGEYVLAKGLITPEALDAASREQEVTGKRIGQILVANGFLSDRDRVEAILDTSSERIALESVARSRIPADLLDEHNIFISAETDETVYVSTMGDEDTVRAIVEEYYGDRNVDFVAFLPGAMNTFISTMRKSSSTEDLSQSAETMLDRLLYRALADGASDIHILPRRESYTAMFRLLGVRRIVHEGALDEFKVMIAQIKDRARMDLAERRKPQDGGFQIEYAGKMIDLRVATLPTQEGETCVMRVLDPDRVQPSLGRLGITRVDRWRKGFSQQHGLCLICGPTGSGKTTTLNSSIKEMDRFGKAIYSIEDPVEYRVPYAGQVSVNSSVGLNFASAVRAFMRADPDVIVLGEVRDEETARNAMKAADTGHLVLATLHTGSILGAVSRLRDLGVEPRELRYLLRSVLVQTLVRTVCPDCGGSGCKRCAGSGYVGRTVVSECEYFQDYDSVDMLLKATGESEVRRTWPTMLEDAVQKMREGQTDLKELYRVFGAAVDMHLHEEEKGTWHNS